MAELFRVSISEKEFKKGFIKDKVFNTKKEFNKFREKQLEYPQTVIGFENCTFSFYCDITVLGVITITTDYIIKDCVFEKGFKLEPNTAVDGTIVGDNIYCNVKFIDTTFKGVVEFNRIDLKGKVDIIRTQMPAIHFFNTDFEQMAVTIKDSNIGIADFHRSILPDGHLEIIHSAIDELILFENRRKRTFKPSLSILQNSRIRDFDISKGLFEDKIEIKNSRIQMIRCDNTTFKSTIDFFGTTFKDVACFYKTDFKATTVFANVTFLKKVIFLYSQLEKNMILRGTEFREGVNFALLNLIGEGYLNTFDLKINDREFATDLNYIANEDKYSSEEKYLRENISSKHKRETYRILKHEALQLNDHIGAIRYYKEEMNEFYRELGNKTKWDKVTLWLNRISSNYGTSQGRGVLFTIIVTFLFYNLFLLAVHIEGVTTVSINWSWASLLENFGTNLKGYLQFLNVTNWDYEPIGIKKESYNGAYAILVLGRLFVGFGIYQTVQAFRKYGRKI